MNEDDAPIIYRIVNTDNFCRDYPDDRFIARTFTTKASAQRAADRMNTAAGEHSDRYYKVELSTYQLQPAFEP